MTLPHLPPPPAQTEHNTTSRPPPPPPPPPLPPRSFLSPAMEPPPAYSSVMSMSSHDPRSSSSQSLVPDPASDNTGRRRLLLVYIHGFMGDETSFRSFPAHVHNLVSLTLSDSHVVHTKIYPRYRARFALQVARDEFSAWLTPHEDQWTDILLLGHSMGGLLAADIALLFRHRILGIVNFDVPFLGMHPGIIKAGLGSIFKSAPPPEDQLLTDAATGSKPSRMSTLFNPKPTDPNYNPTFHNDVHLPVRKGWENALHWFNKHSSGIREASKGLVKSHLEFGGAMADYRALKDRYARVRALEEDDERKRSSANPGVRSPPRIRFVNYYTASTGRPKKPKSPKSPKSPSPSRSGSTSPQHQDSNTPQITDHVHEHRGSEAAVTVPEESSVPKSFVPDTAPELPEIPSIPQEPPFVDLMQYTDKKQRRAAEAEYDEALESYRKAVKERNKIINERQDLEEEWEQKKKQNIIEDRMRLEVQWEKERGRLEASASVTKEPAVTTPGVEQLEEDLGAMQLGHTSDQGGSQNRCANYEFSTNTIMNHASPDDRSSVHTTTTNDTEATTPGSETEAAKKRKLGKFCMLPPNDAYGQKDPTWIRVFMENMDEVSAHTGLFFVNETYERLVGDVGDRIEDWIREADSIRLVREMEGLN